MNIDSYRILSQPVSNGTLYRVDANLSNTVDAGDDVIVERSGDSWQPAASLEGNIDRFSTEQNYALWTDREVSHREGWFWNRQTVIDRPIDGKVDADEVQELDFHRLGSGNLRVSGGNSNAFRVGSEFVENSYGATLEIHSTVFAPLRIIGEGDIAQLKAYRADDQNWQIATKS